MITVPAPPPPQIGANAGRSLSNAPAYILTEVEHVFGHNNGARVVPSTAADLTLRLDQR